MHRRSVMEDIDDPPIDGAGERGSPRSRPRKDGPALPAVGVLRSTVRCVVPKPHTPVPVHPRIGSRRKLLSKINSLSWTADITIGTPVSANRFPGTVNRGFGPCCSCSQPNHGRRFRVQVSGPCVHELAALCEMVCPRIWVLGLVRQRMGKCRFANLARCGRAFRRPIPERTPESVCGSVDPESLQQLHECGVVERFVGGGTRGEDETAAVVVRASLLENRNRSFA